MSNFMYAYSECTFDSDCSDKFSICIGGLCQCKAFFYEAANESCVKCPGIGASCEISSCCSSIVLQCNVEGICVCQNGYENSITCSPQAPPIYVTASQIALSAALIMGMAALTMVVYRLCTKPRYLNARQRALASRAGLNTDTESLSYANYLRASLTSMQIRVLTRLRDRPPTYDSRITVQTAAQLPEAPPPYEGVTEGLPLPPAYTEIVISATGYINSTFVDPDAGPVSRCTDSGSVSNSNYNATLNSNCDINQSTHDTCDKEDKVVECVAAEKTESGDESRIPT